MGCRCRAGPRGGQRPPQPLYLSSRVVPGQNRRNGEPERTFESGSPGQCQAELGTRRGVVSSGAGSMAETRTRRTSHSKGYPRRGEIYLTALDPALGHEIKKTRPALIIQNDISNQYSQTTILAAITSKVNTPSYPNEAVIQPSS